MERVLLGAACLFIVVAVVEMTWPHSMNAAVQPVVVEAGSLVTEPAVTEQLAPSASYLAISDRPLFTVGRRPYEPPVAEPVQAARSAPAPPPPRVVFELVAVVSTPAAKLALLKTDRSPELQKLAVGERYESWTLVDVQPDAVVLQNGHETMTVRLHTDEDERAGSADRPPHITAERR